MVARLLAGSSGRERAPVEKRSASADRWFEPLHVQGPAAARERIAAQVAAGADIVVAPTWRTHRRALMAVGESRRALEWTVAAVAVAREGVDAGLERRAEAAPPEGEDEETEEAELPTPIVRAQPRVAGVLPIIDEDPEPGTGRLLASEPAAARDYDEAAGHLADADVDLILVETRVGGPGSRVAIEAAARTGIETWVAAIGPADESGLATWSETSVDAGAIGLLFADGSVEIASRLAEDVAVAPWGGLVGEVDERSVDALGQAAERWLDHGSSVIGLLRGARPDRVAAIRDTIDQRIRAELAAARDRSAGWDAVVTQAVAMAPGGAGLWLSPALVDVGPLPPGFAWRVASPSDVRTLPADGFRLIVAAPESDVGVSSLASALEVGGILVSARDEMTLAVDGLRPVVIDDRADPPLAIYRREA